MQVQFIANAMKMTELINVILTSCIRTCTNSQKQTCCIKAFTRQYIEHTRNITMASECSWYLPSYYLTLIGVWTLSMEESKHTQRRSYVLVSISPHTTHRHNCIPNTDTKEGKMYIHSQSVPHPMKRACKRKNLFENTIELEPNARRAAYLTYGVKQRAKNEIPIDPSHT